MSDSVQPHRRKPTRLLCLWDSSDKNTGVGCHFLLQCMKVKSKSEVTQSCSTLSDPMDCSLLGSSVHGIFQARVLEWVAIAFSEIHSTDIQITKHTHTCISELQLNRVMWVFRIALIIWHVNNCDGLPWWLSDKELPIPESGRFPEEVNGNPLLYSCLENPMDRGAWQTTDTVSQIVGHVSN